MLCREQDKVSLICYMYIDCPKKQTTFLPSMFVCFFICHLLNSLTEILDIAYNNQITAELNILLDS